MKILPGTYIYILVNIIFPNKNMRVVISMVKKTKCSKNTTERTCVNYEK